MKYFSIIFFLFCSNIFAQNNFVFDAKYCNRLADAIKRIENSKKYPYGIKSIPLRGQTQIQRERYARKICINTIKNNYKRWLKNNLNKNFLKYIADVYCPSQSDFQGNKNWYKNVLFYMSKNNS